MLLTNEKTYAYWQRIKFWFFNRYQDIRHIWCYVNNFGHDYHLTFTKSWIGQRCNWCGYTRAGWEKGQFRERKIENKKVVGIRKRA